MKDGGKGELLLNFDILSGNNNIASVIQSQSKLKKVYDENGAPLNDMATLKEPGGGGGFNLPPNLDLVNYWIMR